MKITYTLSTIMIIASLLFFTSCNNDEKVERDDDIQISEKVDEFDKDAEKVKVIFYNVPSPVEMTSIMKKAGLGFNNELLNSVNNATNYVKAEKIAMNLGVYGADLSYVRIFDQIQSSVQYLSVIKKFTETLGIPQDEGTFTVERLEENLNNRDSLLTIITETYGNADMYLKENNRGSVAALIVMGGWIEALYIATAIVDEKNQDEIIMERIAEQKYSLNNMIELMGMYKDNQAISSYYPQFIELQKIYENVNIIAGEGTVHVDSVTKKTTVSSDSSIEITFDQVTEIHNKVESIRMSIIE